MSRPTSVFIDTSALLHNVHLVKSHAPHQKIMAMVKANAYGCGLSNVIPTLDPVVDALGVASLEEALNVRRWGAQKPCVLMQGIFSADELPEVQEQQCSMVVHCEEQLNWLLARPLKNPIHIWLKVDTGMGRLGFFPNQVSSILIQLQACPWVKKPIGLMTHFSCADEKDSSHSLQQCETFAAIPVRVPVLRSLANSAAILSLPQSHADVVRPGIMLYGASPFVHQTALDVGLKPVMHLTSKITVIHEYPAHTPIGYGGTWQSSMPSRIGIVAIGYGDGYPRHIDEGASVWVKDSRAPIVGRVSMDMLTVDLTHRMDVVVGDEVELWGQFIPVEEVALKAKTIAYELLCQVTARASHFH